MFADGRVKFASEINNNWEKVVDAANPLENDCFIVDTSDFDSSKAGEYHIKISLTDEAMNK